MHRNGWLLILGMGVLAGCSGSSDSNLAPGSLAAAPLSPPPASVSERGALVVSQQGSLVVLDRQGQNARTLTSGFQDSHPSFRADGSDLIFSRLGSGQKAGKADIYRIRLDGTGLTALTAGFPWSAVDPEYSWDGSRIAFAAEVSAGERDIYVMNADGSGLTQVTSGPEVDDHPAFSPDGSTLVFERAERVARVSVRGGPVTELATGNFPSYCPPGDVVVYSRNGELHTLQNGTERPLTTTPGLETQPRHTFEHDKIFTLATYAGGGGDVHVLNPDGTEHRRVTTNLNASELAVGPSSKTTITVNVENNSAYADSDVYVLVKGQNDAGTARFYLGSPNATSLTEFDDTPATLLPRRRDGSFVGNEKYFLKLSSLTRVTGSDHTYTMEVPRENLVSGRIILSFGSTLPGVGLLAPGYAFPDNSAQAVGTPVLTSASSSGTTDSAGNVVSGLTVDATRQLFVGEPVSGSGVPVGAVIQQVNASDRITLSSPLAPNTQVSLTFTCPPLDKTKTVDPSFSGAPDHLIPFEFMELSATSGGSDPYYTLYLNTSVVDFFSVGLGMKVDFLDGSSRSVGFVDGARDKLLADFNTLTGKQKGFQGFVISGQAAISFGNSTADTSKILRVLGPQNIIQLNQSGDFANYLKDAIDGGWTTYQSKVLNLTDDLPGHEPYGFTYTGSLIQGATGPLSMLCTKVPPGTQVPTGLNETSSLPKPSTFIVFKCDDTAPPPNSWANLGSGGHKRLASLLCAALNRGVFSDYQSWSNNKNGQATFYTRADGLYNVYSAILHRYGLDGKVYGFGYDDAYGQDPTIAAPIGVTQSGQTPPGGTRISQVTIKIPSFAKF